MSNYKKIRDCIQTIEKNFGELDEIFMGIDTYWRGLGATAHIDLYRGLSRYKEDILEHIDLLEKKILNIEGDI